MEAKQINYLTGNERTKDKNDSDKLQHKVVEQASIAAIFREVTSNIVEEGNENGT